MEPYLGLVVGVEVRDGPGEGECANVLHRNHPQYLLRGGGGGDGGGGDGCGGNDGDDGGDCGRDDGGF